MAKVTIGQLSASAAIDNADYLEIEHSGVSKRASIGSVGTLIADTERPYATSTESAVGSSSTAVLTPSTLRAGINAENDAPIYACRAWCQFDATTTSSSLSGTYTRVVGTTQTVCVATAHGMITGNIQYIDFVTGGASDNSYIVTVVDPDTFTVNTVSTSSILSSTLSLKRCPILAQGNVGSIAYPAAGFYWVNFKVAMPSQYYGVAMLCHGTTYGLSVGGTTDPTQYAFYLAPITIGGGATAPSRISFSVFA